MQTSDIETKTKNALEVLKRIDSYIASTNTKATLISTISAACITALLFSLYRYDPSHTSACFKALFFITAAAGSVGACVCLAIAISVIFPRTNSSAERNEGDSLIFFGDIATTKGGASRYAEKFRSAEATTFLDDLTEQTFTVSAIASKKFEKLKFLSSALTYFAIVPTGANILCIAIGKAIW